MEHTKWSEGKKLLWVSLRFKLSRVWLAEGKITVNVQVFMKEIKGKSTLAWVNSARLE